MDPTLRALNRFGLGARIGERDGVDAPREWLRSQLDGPVPAPEGDADLGEVSDTLTELRAARRSSNAERIAALQARLREIEARHVSATFALRVTTDAPYLERLVAFWSNHLCISTLMDGRVAAFSGHYERSVVRRHVLGRFSDMVLASAKHPAMLVYLDNVQSVGPNSPAGRQAARRGEALGLNENYARELLELHTVGVDGGYSQEDVEELARILTGWTVGGIGRGGQPDERASFVFRPRLHEPRSKVVLETRYAGEPWEQPRPRGVEEGEEVIRDLCARPATAEFLATKLVRHFVADDPPAAAVDRIARTFLDSEGDLGEVSAALIELDEAWDDRNRKFRTPQEWMMAVLRAVGADEAPRRTPGFMRQLAHGLWRPRGPDGYSDTEPAWADPDALMNRAELARTLAGSLRIGEGVDPARLLEVMDVPASDPLRSMVHDSSIAAPDRMALAFSAPAFQWR